MCIRDRTSTDEDLKKCNSKYTVYIWWAEKLITRQTRQTQQEVFWDLFVSIIIPAIQNGNFTVKLGSFLSKVFWSKFRVFFSPNFLYFHTSHFFFQILQSIGMRNVPNIFAFFPKIGTRSVPNILPSAKFPNFVNVSCFSRGKKKGYFCR